MSAPLLDRFRRVDAIFDAALDRPPGERAAWVERACDGDADLCTEVLRLLRAHDQSEGFLDAPAAELAAPLLSGSELLASAARVIPARIGPFRIVREIGHGGMGAVFLGERDEAQFRQRVAVKLIRMGGATGGFVHRFLEERRILAMLEHPNIARLVDGGVTTDGLPWFAMEYVEGEPLDVFCDARRLTVAQRLELFARICDAVQYAHQHLVVHRDLKPANIMVDTEGRLKLLDFGIARLLDAGAADRADATLTALHAMTPEYASPEQVRGAPVSTATDVYALGVLLYRLLTGDRPYDVRGRSPADVERIICEFEPAPPSRTFARDGRAAGESRARADARNGSPVRLRRTLRGDLDLIVLKALSKEPDRRYPSVAALQDDLRRLATGLPIVARAPTTGYRLRRFVRRHRSAVASTAVLLLLLAGGAARERTLRARAEAETRKARAVEEYLVSIFDLADPFARPDESGSDVTARTLLDRGVARLETQLAEQPAVRAELRGVLGRVFTSLGLFDEAVPMLERSLEEQRALYGGRHEAVADALDRLGIALVSQNRLAEAEPLLREALDQRRRLLGDLHLATATSLEHLGTLLQERNDFDGADPLFRESLDIRRALLGDDDLTVGAAINDVALLSWHRGDYAKADSLYRITLDIQTGRLGENHPSTAQTLHNLAQAAQLLGRTDEAESLYRRALAAKRASLGNAHPSVTINLNNLGRLLALAGRPDEAEPLIREALALDRQIFGDRHSYVGQSLNNLGLVLRMKGEFDGAERSYRESLAINLAQFGENHTFVALNYYEIASARYLAGDLGGAIELYRRSYELYERLLGESHLSTLTVGANFARALREAGRLDEADVLYGVLLGKLDEAAPQHRPALIFARLGAAQILAARGAYDQACPALERVLELARTQFGSGTWRTAESELALGECFLAQRRLDEAEPLLRQAVASLEANRRSYPRVAARAAATLARLESEKNGRYRE